MLSTIDNSISTEKSLLVDIILVDEILECDVQSPNDFEFTCVISLSLAKIYEFILELSRFDISAKITISLYPKYPSYVDYAPERIQILKHFILVQAFSQTNPIAKRAVLIYNRDVSID